jgi:hypothetical protein
MRDEALSDYFTVSRLGAICSVYDLFFCPDLEWKIELHQVIGRGWSQIGYFSLAFMFPVPEKISR